MHGEIYYVSDEEMKNNLTWAVIIVINSFEAVSIVICIFCLHSRSPRPTWGNHDTKAYETYPEHHPYSSNLHTHQSAVCAP